MDIKEDMREEESGKAQDIKREGAEGFAAADILGELFNNDEGTKADVAPAEALSSENGEGDNAMPCVASDDNADVPTCESADESAVDGEVTTANAADESIESTAATSGENAEVIDTKNESNTSPSGNEGDSDDGQIAIDLGDGTRGAIIDVGSDDPIAGENGDGMTDDTPNEQGEATDNEPCDTAEATESDTVDENEEALPSPADRIFDEESATTEKEPEALDDELEREHFYHETQDPAYMESLSPTPALELTEASKSKEDRTEQLSIFDIEEQEGEPAGRGVLNKIFDFLELFAFTLLVVVLLLSFFFRHSVVDGDSMMGTLNNGEHLIISDLFYSPERGDIIVFEDHTTGFKKPLIKRIIAVGGDEIRISGQSVYVNGEALTEDYVYVDGLYHDPSIVLVVPEGELFVMGDHRNESSDSRIFGTISEDSVIGRVVLRFYPLDTFGRVDD